MPRRGRGISHPLRGLLRRLFLSPATAGEMPRRGRGGFLTPAAAAEAKPIFSPVTTEEMP
jgi:hypothetical protein